MSEISIIVPVYNAAAYLRKSLDSIVNQSYRDIEFIFVDDGSCDDSLAILKEYEAADKRVTVLHQENRGAGAARNYGMSVAGGKYLLFLDCDDIFETSMVEKMHSRAETDNTDVLVCGQICSIARQGKDRMRPGPCAGNICHLRKFSRVQISEKTFLRCLSGGPGTSCTAKSFWMK